MLFEEKSKPTRMKQISFKRPKSKVAAIAFSKVKDKLVLLATWRNGTVMTFDIENGKILNRCHTPLGLRDCAISNDGQQVILGGTHGRKIFEFGSYPDGEVTKEDFLQPTDVTSVNFSDDNNKVSIGIHGGDNIGCDLRNRDTELLLHRDTEEGDTALLHFCKGEEVKATVISPNGMILAVGCPRKVSLNCITSGDCCQTFRFAEGVARSIKFSKNGNRIFFSTADGKMVYAYDVYSGDKEIQVSRFVE